MSKIEQSAPWCRPSIIEAHPHVKERKRDCVARCPDQGLVELTSNDNHVTHEGVTYYLSANLPPLKSHMLKCPRCAGVGKMYGRDCMECKGRGLLYQPLPDERAKNTGGVADGEGGTDDQLKAPSSAR